ncbi:Crp/Fnr family transcriptional regulator [Lysinibacillus endophyticus]|uniref:Crp/Fnr family transcriptional regulator n=1 Tax=Ureibacillus endophyticus TaxID=1978490 RepID=UPI003136F2A8
MVETLPIEIIHLFEEHGLLVKVEKGSNIYREGEKATDILLIKEGSVRISKETEDAKEITFRICGKHSIIGEFPLFSATSSIRSTTAKANSHTELLALNKDSLEMLLMQKPALMIEYLKWLQNENLKNQSLLRDLILHGKKGALYSTLIRLANTYGEQKDDKIFINHYLTNTDIANLCSTSREMINRMLNELKKQGIISMDKGFITITNIRYLKQAICCENCPSTICRID